MNRKDQYKHGAADVSKLKDKRRDEEVGLRKQRRDGFLDAKRVRLEEEDGEAEEFTQDQVRQIAKAIQKHGSQRLDLLKQLKRMFAQGSALIDAFLSVDNSLRALVGILSGHDPALQLEAAWCITNFSASIHEHCMLVLQSAAPYLVTYLSSQNAALQDQSCWALGNLAGDGPECRDGLVAQGAVQPLVRLLKSPTQSVVQSAAFALSNLARGKDANLKSLIDAGIAEPLVQLLEVTSDQATMAEVAWSLTYLTARGEYEQLFVSLGIIQRVVSALDLLSKQKPHDSAVVTPLVRCLGNICSGPDKLVTMATQDGNLLPSIGRLLQSDHRHIKKETLWALSNMTEAPSVCQQIVSLGILPSIIALMESTYDIKKEAVVCLCNLAYQGPIYCHELITHGAFPGVIRMLRNPDPDAVGLVLGFADMILKNDSNGKRLFEEHGGLDLLEPLEYHSNPTIQQQTAEFLEVYFYQEDDDTG